MPNWEPADDFVPLEFEILKTGRNEPVENFLHSFEVDQFGITVTILAPRKDRPAISTETLGRKWSRVVDKTLGVFKTALDRWQSNAFTLKSPHKAQLYEIAKTDVELVTASTYLGRPQSMALFLLASLLCIIALKPPPYRAAIKTGLILICWHGKPYKARRLVCLKIAYSKISQFAHPLDSNHSG